MLELVNTFLAMCTTMLFVVIWILNSMPESETVKPIVKPVAKKPVKSVPLCCQKSPKTNECSNSVSESETTCCQSQETLPEKHVQLIYASEGGTAQRLAHKISSKLAVKSTVVDIASYEAETIWKESSILIFILSTYTNGGPSSSAQWFSTWLQDSAVDCRVGVDALKSLNYAVFGTGDSAYKEHFGTFAKNVDKTFLKMGATCVSPCLIGDQADDFESLHSFVESVNHYLNGTVPLVETTYVSSDEEDVSDAESDGMVDLEDLGKIMSSRSTDTSTKEMVTPALRKSLEKQRYTIVGSHSGVKVCRWTKAMLRGRGGCYKHSFYGIESHRCMETTPSLACANKCVFCWRHHSNPVGTEWKWKMDEPEVIVKGAMEGHYKMIKSFKGVPGVIPERFEEGMQIRHCALSLVGEPIMYPKINEFVGLLHAQKISSFLVTNAQFPEQIQNLVPVTQLYVSVDAGTKDGLKKIDRPLFSDFWERYLSCLDELKRKGQRTVYRLTLVKAFNTEEIQNYASLIRRGSPDFIEVKGVTFCGFTGSQPLTMSNVPYHKEVIAFCQQLVAEIDPDFEYEIASEHEHSCSVLMAKKKFKINGKWHTWIDYEKFHELIQSGNSFTSLDYMAQTPDWAVYGDNRRGFDPAETRFYRKQKETIEAVEP